MGGIVYFLHCFLFNVVQTIIFCLPYDPIIKDQEEEVTNGEEVTLTKQLVTGGFKYCMSFVSKYGDI